MILTFLRNTLLIVILIIFVGSLEAGANSIDIRPAKELGTVFFMGKPQRLLNHPIILQNELIKNIKIFLEHSLPSENYRKIINRIQSCHGKFSSTQGVESMLIRMDGNFRDIDWDVILYEHFSLTRVKMKGLKKGRKLYKVGLKQRENANLRIIRKGIFSPYVLIDSDTIVIGLEKHLGKLKRMDFASWKASIEKEFSSNTLEKHLNKSLLLFSYIPPKVVMEKANNEIERELQGIPLYFPITGFKQIILGLGESQDQFHYFMGLGFSDSKDIHYLKNIGIGCKSFFQLILKKMRPVKLIIDKSKIVTDANLVALAGSFSANDINKLINYTTMQMAKYQQHRRSRWDRSRRERRQWERENQRNSKDDDSILRDKTKKRDRIMKLSRKVLDSFTKNDYKSLSPILAKGLKPSLDPITFRSYAREVKNLGSIKMVNFIKLYDYSYRKGETFNLTSKLLIVKDKKTLVYIGYFEFIKEGNQYKLLSLHLRIDY